MIRETFFFNTDSLIECHEAEEKDERMRGPKEQRVSPKIQRACPFLFLVEETKQKPYLPKWRIFAIYGHPATCYLVGYTDPETMVVVSIKLKENILSRKSVCPLSLI